VLKVVVPLPACHAFHCFVLNFVWSVLSWRFNMNFGGGVLPENLHAPLQPLSGFYTELAKLCGFEGAAQPQRAGSKKGSKARAMKSGSKTAAATAAVSKTADSKGPEDVLTLRVQAHKAARAQQSSSSSSSSLSSPSAALAPKKPVFNSWGQLEFVIVPLKLREAKSGENAGQFEVHWEDCIEIQHNFLKSGRKEQVCQLIRDAVCGGSADGDAQAVVPGENSSASASSASSADELAIRVDLGQLASSDDMDDACA